MYGIYYDYIHMVEYKKFKAENVIATIYATYANVSLVPSTRSMYSFSSSVSIACRAHVSVNGMRDSSHLPF